MIAAGITGVISFIPITAFVVASVLYHKNQKQNVGTEEIRRELANMMRRMYGARECNRIGREITRTSYHITQQTENILNQYFEDQEPLVVN